MLPSLSFKDVQGYVIELRMRLQRVGISIDDIEKIVVGRKQSIWDLKLFLMNWLQFKENEAQMISRWVIENSKEGAKSMVNYDEDWELDK